MVHPLKINFHELYRRHLCRHSQFGLNALHLVAVAGIYVSLYRIVLAIPGSQWILLLGLLVYLAVLFAKVPFRVWLVSTTAVIVLLASAIAAPELPIWFYLGVIVFLHWFQNWSHRFYTKTFDMSEFKERYPKGFSLFFTLSLFELPILVNYLAFDRRNWVA